MHAYQNNADSVTVLIGGINHTTRVKDGKEEAQPVPNLSSPTRLAGGVEYLTFSTAEYKWVQVEYICPLMFHEAHEICICAYIQSNGGWYIHQYSTYCEHLSRVPTPGTPHREVR